MPRLRAPEVLPNANAILCVQNIAAYPISQGRILNVAASITNREQEGTIYEGPWTTEVSQEEVRKEYVGWEPEVEEIMQVCLMSPFCLASLTSDIYVANRQLEQVGHQRGQGPAHICRRTGRLAR